MPNLLRYFLKVHFLFKKKFHNVAAAVETIRAKISLKPKIAVET